MNLTIGRRSRARRSTTRLPRRPLTALSVVVVSGLLVGVSGLLGAASPALGQTNVPDVGLELTALDGVLGPGASPAVDATTTPIDRDPRAVDGLRMRLLITNHGDSAVDGLRVISELHPATSSRDGLRLALRGDLLSAPLVVHGEDVRASEPLLAGDIAGVELDLSDHDIPWASDPGGVHPLRISLVRGTQTIDEFVTAVVWLDTPPSDPVATSVVLPLDTAPWRTTGGAFPDGVDREIRPGGRLDVLIGAAERAPDELVTLAPASHLLEDLAQRAGGFQELTRGESGNLEGRRLDADSAEAVTASVTLRRIREASLRLGPPLASTYADAELEALLEAGGDHADLAATAASEGRRRLPRQLGQQIDPTFHLVDGSVGPASLDVIPAEAVLLRGLDDPEQLDDSATLDDEDPVRTIVAPSGRRVSALVADPYLQEALSDGARPGGPVATAQAIVAHTARFHLENPTGEDRSLVLYPPARWSIGPQAADLLLTELDEASWLRAASLAEILGATTVAPEVSSLPTPSTPPSFGSGFLDELGAAREGVDALAAGLPDTRARIDGRTIEELEDDLLRATSRWYGGVGDAAALVRDVDRATAERLGDVEVTTGTVTLTSDTGQIPVSVQRPRGGPLQVVVSVESPGRLLWPEGRRSETILLDEASSQTVSFTARALSTGTFPVTVRVTDPAGLRVLTETTVSVRSTAISGPALIGTGAIVAALLLVGALRRRRPDPDPATGPHPGHERPQLEVLSEDR